jgi:hypothetical protein
LSKLPDVRFSSHFNHPVSEPYGNSRANDPISHKQRIGKRYYGGKSLVSGAVKAFGGVDAGAGYRNLPTSGEKAQKMYQGGIGALRRFGV